LGAILAWTTPRALYGYLCLFFVIAPLPYLPCSPLSTVALYL
jgi:hypothetical protein